VGAGAGVAPQADVAAPVARSLMTSSTS
jgi:hypothetical protein